MASQGSVSGKDTGGTIKQIALAFELPFMVVAPVLLGGGIGYLLDRWLHTKPLLMIVLGIVGVILGIRDALKAASAEDQKNRG
ncbi:MAG: AtpZ/AtpI family protein [Candidatus Acidiferrales bacterium]